MGPAEGTDRPAVAPATTDTAPRARDLARRPTFVAFLVGNGVSAAGTHFQTIAQSVLMYRLTDSTLLVGVTVSFQFVGVFACAPYSAAAADRFDRRALLAWLSATSCALNVAMAVLVGTGVMTPTVLLVFALATGLVHSFAQPVLQSFVPQLVAPHELTTAVSLSNTSFTVARTLGPIAAAGTIAAFGLTTSFAVNAASYVVFLVVLTVLRPRALSSDGVRRRFRDGLAVAGRDPAISRALSVLVGIVVVTEPVTTLTPEFATSVFGASDAAVGLLIGAFGVGATLAGMLLGRYRRDVQTAMAMGFAGASAGLVALAASPHLAVGLVALVVMGAGYLHCVTTAMTVLLARTPAAQHGLIMAIWSIAFFGSRPFAALSTGGLAAMTSARWASLLLGLVALVLGVLITRRDDWAPAALTVPPRLQPTGLKLYNDKVDDVTFADPPPRPVASPELVDVYTSRGWWGTDTLREVLRRHAMDMPDGTAIVEGEQSMTWVEYHTRSEQLAGVLATTAMRPGDRVAIMVPDGPLVHVLFVAAEKAGLVVMAIGPRAGVREIQHLIRRSGATTFVTAAGHRDDELAKLLGTLRAELPRFRHHLVVERDGSVRLDGAPVEMPRAADLRVLLDGRGPNANELFLLNSTSGTTGLPKCVMHHQNRWFYFHDLAVAAGDLGPDDVFMSVVPAPFGFGIWTSHVTPLLLGCPTIVLERFSARATIEAIERHRATVLSAVSTQFIMMLNESGLREHDLSSLRMLFTGGEAVPRHRAAEFESRTGARVLQFYGSNETGALSRTSLDDDEAARLDTAGRTIDEMQVRLIDDAGDDITETGGPGQPVCRGPATCLGYYQDDEANHKLVRPDGWMTTGDIATLDDRGYLRIVGRTSDIIIRGGKNISAPAVEAEVLTHPSIALAAAVAVPDETFGERVCIVVSTVDGREATLDDITLHLDQRGVTKEWWPEYLLVLDEIPRASGGKIAKGELRELVKQRFAPVR